MLQKPSLEELEGLSKTHLFLMDIGIWILSDRAIEVLMKRSLKEGTKDITYYDLYSDYGLALGEHPKTKDEEINQLNMLIDKVNKNISAYSPDLDEKHLPWQFNEK